MRGADGMPPVRLVAGLGNPGREYAATRHNAGFWFADALAARLGAAFKSESKFQGHVAKAAGDLRFLKPMTYMNLSGRSVAAAARFFAIAPDEILVVHDELDLLPGEAKMKFGGGIAGHNGSRHRGAARHAGLLAAADRHRPSARLGDSAAGRRRLRPGAARRSATARRSTPRSTARSTPGRRSKPASSSARCSCCTRRKEKP